MKYRYINGETVEAVSAPGGEGDGGSDQISFTFADGAPGRAHKSLLIPLNSEDEEPAVTPEPFGVGDIVRFKPYEYKVTAYDYPDEVEMEPVVPGFGDRWHLDPEMLEYVRTPPPEVEDGSVWEHATQGYRVLVSAPPNGGVFFASPGEAPIQVDPDYLRTHFKRLL